MKNNYCIHIYTTHKNHDRCKIIEQTWGRHVQNLFFYTDKETSNPKYIKCTEDDSYESHMYKNFYALENASKMPIDWHLFIGDDNFIYHYNLEFILNVIDPNHNAIFGEILEPGVGYEKLRYVGGGAGLLVNQVSLKNILLNDDLTYEEKNKIGYSDAVIGTICQKAKIFLSQQYGFHTHQPWAYGIRDPENHISFHYIKKEEEFNYLYSRYRKI
jgi:hypothetical protein